MQPSKIEASCTWGFGDDVSLSFEDNKGEKIFIDLTTEQAMQLVSDLLKAGMEANKINISYLNYSINTLKEQDTTEKIFPVNFPF